MASNVFDTELNTSGHENTLDSMTMSTADMLGGGAVATVVDFGASLWNSLPGTDYVATEDILSRVSTNALKVYEEHPDAIHTASFIGGLAVPIGLSAKTMGAMRAGVKGVNWFGEGYTRAADLAKITEAVDATKGYRDLARGIYAKTAINQSLDAVAAELAIVGLMNAHPFMEDYMKDLPSNFAYGAMLGGALGAGVGVIADRFAIKAAEGSAFQTAINLVNKTGEVAYQDMSNTLRLHANETSIKNLEELMQSRITLGKNETNDLTYQIAKQYQLDIRAQQASLFDSMLSQEIKDLPAEQRDPIMRTLIDNKAMLGAENIRFLTENEVTAKGFIKVPKFSLGKVPEFIGLNSSKKGPVIPKKQEAVYFPELGLYGTKNDAIHYAGASVYGRTKEQLAKDINYKSKVPNFDSELELPSMSAAEAQRQYIGVWERVKSMSPKELSAMHIGETDGAALNAVIWRMATDPEVAGIKIKVSNNLPVMKQIVKEHVEKLVQEGKITAQEAANIGPDAVYAAKLDKLGKEIGSNQFFPSIARQEIRAWIGGDKMEFNKAALDFHADSVKGSYAKSGVDPAGVAKFERIYNSPESQMLRQRFQQLADHDGFVYLYRGWQTNEIKGAQMLDSFTTHYEKAAQFTKHNPDKNRAIKLYKVPVDDIVAGFRDVGGGEFNAEIIVRASARTPVAELSPTGKMALKQAAEEASVSGGKLVTTKTTILKETIQDSVNNLGLPELTSLFVAQKQAALDAMIKAGMPMESIALKTNTDFNVVKAYAMTKQTGVGLDSFVPPNTAPMVALNNIKRYDDIDEALSPARQPWVLSSNTIKNPLYIEKNVALDGKMARMLNREFSSDTMAASKSSAAQAMDKLFYSPEGLGSAVDAVRARIGAINNALAGSPLLNSLDFVTRNMGDIGPAVSAIGKEVQEIARSTAAKVMMPIEAAMTEVQKDAGAMIEFATFFNVNAGLKGWRGIDKEGYIVQKVMRENEAGEMVEVLERVKYKTKTSEKEYRITVPSVRKLVDEIQSQSTELRELANTINRLKGTADINDIGLWMPSFNPIDKHIAYVHDTVEGTTKLLWATSQKEFDSMLGAFKKRLLEEGTSKRFDVVVKQEQKNFNLLNGRLDPILMERADIGMLKTGASASEIIKPDLALFGEMAKGYEYHISAQVRNLADLNLYELTDSLQRMSSYNKRLSEAQPLSALRRAITHEKDIAAVMRNALLGSPNLGEYAGWQVWNRGFEVAVGMAANKVNDVWNEVAKPLLGKVKFKDSGDIEIAGNKKINYKDLNEQLEARGIQYPWAGMDEQVAKEAGYFSFEQSPDAFKRLIYGGNALVATLALRFGEIAQPLVNAMSMPIITSMAMVNKMPESFLGVQKKTMNIWPSQVMYEGIRAMHSPNFAALNKRWKEAGYFKPLVSEVTDVLRATHKFDKGITATIENALDSTVVKAFSAPADLAESMTRKAAMNIGAQLGKRLYPELDDVGITVFARDFMDKALGNFHAAQRPVMFQGTLGVALGLFQTYMWTMGQSVYRHLEHGNYKAIGKAALLQSGIFGAGSMPGFDAVSNMIADKFSDDNIDLVTGTYRATGDAAADVILYGLPSNLGIGTFSTRGDISPRFPTKPSDLVSANFVGQMIKSLGQVGSALNTQSSDMGRSFLQALSLQSMSRPLARSAELVTGYSMTQRGNTVQVPEEVWTFTGIASRLMSTRPIEEQKLRDADHLNHFYGSLDRDNREEAMTKLKTSIRNGTLSDELLASTAEKYFRNGGSPAGWRSAINNAIARTEESGRETFISKLRPNSPLNFMIDGME